MENSPNSNLSDFFTQYLKKESLFKSKDVFKGNFIPDVISHRDEQIQFIAQVLAPLTKSEKPSNLFIYGKTGTGKTLSIKYVISQMEKLFTGSTPPFKTIYVNCKIKRIADTEYRLIAELAREFGQEIPYTGLPTDEVYKIFYNSVNKANTPILIVMDEIDQLVKKTGDDILYNLTRANESLDKAHISLVGLSNDVVFIDHIDPRVKSSLSKEDLIFPPYNAFQIQDILRQRVNLAFKEGVLTPGTVEKCAAYAAREHGDARRALELIRVAAELAERKNDTTIDLEHIDLAEDKIEKDRLLDIVVSQPKQSQCILYSIVHLSTSKKNIIFTGEIYDSYKGVCEKIGLRPLTQRRISDVIAELDMFGVINAKTISKGRYGRTREISLNIPDASISNIKSLLEKELII